MAWTKKAPLAFVLLALLLGCGLMPGAGTAYAEGEAAATNGPPPTVSFVEEEPLEVNAKDLKESIEEELPLPVKIHNGSPRAQKVTLEVIGSEKAGVGPEEEEGAAEAEEQGADEGIASLFPDPPLVIEEMEPGETATFDLPLTQPEPETKKATYSLTLIASGASGGLARRDLTIDYQFEAPTAGSGENALSPNRPIDITLHAVNYLPSLLSSLLGFGVFVGLALFTAALVFRQWLMQKCRNLWVLGIAVAVLIGVVCLVFVLKDDPWSNPSVHAISSRPIDLAPEVPEGTIGTVAAEDGSIAQLISADQKLRPEDLDGAEKLSGHYSLEGKHEKAEADATVDVRDFWIWAVVAISLGLLIGYFLRRWFQEKRPKMKVWSALKRARLAYEGELEVLNDTDGDRPYANTTIDQRVYSRQTEIERLIETNEPSKATEKVTALLAYVIRFVEFRERLRKLDAACAELKDIPQLELLDFSLSEANGYQDAEALLAASIDSPSLDSGEDELKALLAKVNSQIDLIVATTRSVQASIRHVLTIPKVKKALGPLHGDQPAKLRTIELEFFAAAEKKLQASTFEQLEEAKADDDKALRELGKFTRPEEGQPGLKLDIEVERGLLAPGEDVISRGGAASPLQLTFTAAKPAPKIVVDLDFSWSIEGIESKDGDEDEPPIHVGDMVRFEIDFTRGLPVGFAEIEVDFGDKSPQRRLRLPTEGQTVFVRHRYKKKGSPKVVVFAVPGGQVLGKKQLAELVAEERPLDSEVRLADSEKAVTTAAFLLAVASGMGALYFNDPAWGQPMDYLAAIVWGGATGEGVKYAAAIADRIWPLS